MSALKVGDTVQVRGVPRTSDEWDHGYIAKAEHGSVLVYWVISDDHYWESVSDLVPYDGAADAPGKR